MAQRTGRCVEQGKRRVSEESIDREERVEPKASTPAGGAILSRARPGDRLGDRLSSRPKMAAFNFALSSLGVGNQLQSGGTVEGAAV